MSHALKGEGFDASEDGTGRSVPLVVGPLQAGGAKAAGSATQQDAESGLLIAFSSKDHGADAGEIAPTLRAMPHDGSHANGGGQVAVAFSFNGDETPKFGEDIAGSMKAEQGGEGYGVVTPTMAVRRLTPTECERLQGFPDSYTAVTHRRKLAADGPRYKALGNSMAVPCIQWLGERIARTFKPEAERCA